MEILLALASIASLCIQIWLIVLFVRLSANVETIKMQQRSKNTIDTTANELKNDVHLALLLGAKDEAYTKIVSWLYKSLYTAEMERKHHQFPTIHEESVISDAANLCSMLGMALPPELSSPDAFKQFIK